MHPELLESMAQDPPTGPYRPIALPCAHQSYKQGRTPNSLAEGGLMMCRYYMFGRLFDKTYAPSATSASPRQNLALLLQA